MAEQARTEMGVETLDVVADRGYYASEEIRACEEAGITVTKAYDLEREGGRSLRKAGLRLCRGRRCLYLSSSGAADLSLHQ